MKDRNSSYNKPKLDYLFHPESVAVAGVSGDLTKLSGGRIFTENLINAGFRGKIYPVGPGGGELLGYKIYPGIADIPDKVDFVISSVPAKYAPRLLQDSAAKGVKAMHLFTAGFSESGDDEGAELESEVLEIARQTGIRLVGPNCMGLYCPSSGLSFCADFPRESGSVGFLSQSGGHSLYGTLEATARGIRFSKVISYGNASDLNECDYLEYLAEDPDTSIIAVYIEGARDGHRLIEVLKRAAQLKPLIIFKGGTTEYGSRTAHSHTASITGSDSVWSGLIRQVGAIQVDSTEEMFDVVLLFNHISPPRSRNVALAGLGGGFSVHAADVFAREGLTIPMFPPEITERLMKTDFTSAGKIFNNPVDIFAHGSSQLIQHVITTVLSIDQIDFLVVHVAFDTLPSPEAWEGHLYVEALNNLTREINRRTVVVLHTVALPRSKKLAAEVQEAIAGAGYAVYPSFNRAAKAIARFAKYHQC